MRRFCVAMVATATMFMLAGCGDGDSSDTGGVASPDDSAMNEQMTDCVRQWMSEVALTPEVDTATTEQLAAANEVYLEDCGDQRIADHDIQAGYECNGNGCFGDDGTGYSWRTVAADWACESQPDLCALAD